MAGSTSKKVVVHRFDREPLSGFVNQSAWLTPDGVELLTQSGSLVVVPYGEIRAVFFVRNFDADPWSGLKRTFLSRPRLNGLWVKLHFRDGESLEAVAPNDLLQMQALGINVIPPDPALRIWIPRAALTGATVLSVIGGPLRSRKPAPPKEQIGLFEQSA